MRAKSFVKTLNYKPLTRIILMIQIRGNGLLTVIKVDVITRAVTKLWGTLISPPFSLQQSATRRIFKLCHIKTQCTANIGKIIKRQQRHRQINKHIKQDWGDRNSGKSAAQSGSFVGLVIARKSVHQQPVSHKQKQLDRNPTAHSSTEMFDC